MLAIFEKLEGPAKLWLDRSVEMFSSWPEFIEELIEEFSDRMDETEIHHK